MFTSSCGLRRRKRGGLAACAETGGFTSLGSLHPMAVRNQTLHSAPMEPPSSWLDARCAAAGALLFDLDGTLADTMTLHLDAWQRVLGERGVTLDRERYFSMAGIPTRRILPILAEEPGVQLD